MKRRLTFSVRKGHHFSVEGVRKEYLFCQKWYIKGWGVVPRNGASTYPHPRASKNKYK